MKIRVSDLLDGYLVQDTISLDGGDPDPEPILARVKGRMAGQPRRRGRPARWAAAIAALAALFTLTAAAVHLGGGSLWSGFFAQKSGQSLSGAQLALLDQLSASRLPPAVSNGVTLTPLASVNDAHTLYLYLRVEAPEGTALPDMGEQEDHVFLDFDLRTGDGQRGGGGMQKAYWLADSTPGDHVTELVFILYGHYADPELNPQLDFTDGVPRTLILRDLLLNPRDSEEFLLLEGEWRFSLEDFSQCPELDLEVSGLTRWDGEAQATVTLEELRITPLSLTYRMSYQSDPAAGDPAKAAPQLGLDIVMRDGSTLHVSYGSGTFGPDCGMGIHSFRFPIPLDQVAYLQFGEHQIFLPQTE